MSSKLFRAAALTTAAILTLAAAGCGRKAPPEAPKQTEQPAQTGHLAAPAVSMRA
ncbi:MAG: hypothetical protein KTR21_02855 [Rhodobacteraceae bacterium]|nr:hypothetical protein [Paracoccaceae bacterium]